MVIDLFWVGFLLGVPAGIVITVAVAVALYRLGKAKRS